MSEIKLTLKSTRLSDRNYHVLLDDGTNRVERALDDASASYAVHVVLRDYISEFLCGAKLSIETNSNSLIRDIESLLDGEGYDKPLRRILQRTLDDQDVEIISVRYSK